jgi:Zn-dependent peptidase ImmA (M78 family)
MPIVDAATIGASRIEAIKSLALSTLEINRIGVPPVNAIILAKKYGFHPFGMVFDPKYAKCVAGFIDIENSKIIVNAEDTPACQNFTIAHELGHYLLRHHEAADFDSTYSVLLRATDIQLTPMEVEANIFADNLLVPAMFLREYLIKYPYATDQELANIFGVPSEVIQYRKPFV